MVEQIDEERFAKIDKSVFETADCDTNRVIKELDEATNYISMKQIIAEAADSDSSLEKTMFKVRTNSSNYSSEEAKGFECRYLED